MFYLHHFAGSDDDEIWWKKSILKCVGVILCDSVSATSLYSYPPGFHLCPRIYSSFGEEHKPGYLCAGTLHRTQPQDRGKDLGCHALWWGDRKRELVSTMWKCSLPNCDLQLIAPRLAAMSCLPPRTLSLRRNQGIEYFSDPFSVPNTFKPQTPHSGWKCLHFSDPLSFLSLKNAYHLA